MVSQADSSVDGMHARDERRRKHTFRQTRVVVRQTPGKLVGVGDGEGADEAKEAG